jgi:serine/threonine-protein kinase
MALEVDPARRSVSPQALALMLADGTPGDGYQPSGLELLKTHADELLEGGHERETMRSPAQRMDASSSDSELARPPAAQLPRAPEAGRPIESGRPIEYGSGAQPQRVAAQLAVQAAPMSTLGTIASQAFPVAQAARPRRPWLAVGIGVVAAAAIGTVVLAKQPAPTTTRPGEARVSLEDMTTASVPAPVHVPMPVHGEADVVAVPVADAGTPEVPRMAAITTTAADAGPIATSQLAVHPHDAGALDATRVAAIAPIAVDAGPIASPALAAHPLDAGMPDAAIKARAEPVATGNLKVVILPWAEVWVDGKPLGQTPVRAKISVGPHRVRLKNDTKEKTVTVTVTAARTAVINETW